MADLKLPKLPDRTPVKIGISVMPDVFEALNAYADAYEASYGRRESVPDLIPFMLDSFLASDRSFSRTRRRESHGAPAPRIQRPGRASGRPDQRSGARSRATDGIEQIEDRPAY